MNISIRRLLMIDHETFGMVVDQVNITVTFEGRSMFRTVNLPEPTTDSFLALENITNDIIMEWLYPLLEAQKEEIANRFIEATKSDAKKAVPKGTGGYRVKEHMDEWKVGEDYSSGTVVYHESKLYRVIQPHTSQAGWAPKDTAALFTESLIANQKFPAWKQPQGTHDAYPEGIIVLHEGNYYQTNVPANVWPPPEQWTQINESALPDGNIPGDNGVWNTDFVPSDPPPGDAALWVQPTGAHDAYAQGDQVLYQNKTWESDIDANVWAPPTQWTEI